ncbi:DMT family transporter [Methanolapillus millepedarum]|uniref:EamA domain-containing protein n=1 Tax=Methanolapillus millepedarum TaxID=3028296 RepID=A0AA96ZWB4_9EURY|nr:hypothetical protein MsAc7_13220 [Methanosarcinaceae archaeon Ac7]
MESKVKINNSAIGLALLAALLFGLNAPFSKMLLDDIPPMLMVSLLYLGAGIGIFILRFFSHAAGSEKKEAKITKKELPWTILMILLDIVAPFLLMLGLSLTTAENASLLFNFEMVATSVIALIFFKEAVGKRMWLSIGIITLASIILSIDWTASTFRFSTGSLLVLAACCCWGLENNCTRNMSEKDPAQIVILKGFGSGLGAALIFFLFGQSTHSEFLPEIPPQILLYAMILGFVSYGLSIFLYVKAQRHLGAARTSAYYAAAPFMGVIVSFILFGTNVTASFWVAAALMIIGVWLAVKENHNHEHLHEEITHEHRHGHDDGHHDHEWTTPHPNSADTHTHAHTHKKEEHAHTHNPDIHHRHLHE